MTQAQSGAQMYALAKRLWPICRSLTGDGVRQTLAIMQELLPTLMVHEVPSGTPAFDWQVPAEWRVRDAYIADLDGNRLVDFQQHNLHLVGYSTPIDAIMSREELEPHLYSLPHQPTAIPYVTSYYRQHWGFCLSQQQRDALPAGPFRVQIDSELFAGALSYGEWYLPGESQEEVLLSTYVCHPSMANNELSGPVVAVELARWLASAPRRLSYRLLLLPETIGSIVYLSRHLPQLQQRLKAGFVMTCMGDERTYSYLASRRGNTLADRVALHVLQHRDPHFQRYSFLQRGSDERQYCSPGVDLPVVSMMRSKYGTYPEYHTSLDNLSLITPAGLQGSLEMLQQAIGVLELDRYPQATVCCEPQLGKRGLYPTISTRESGYQVRTMMNLLAYADGQHSLLELADMLNQPFATLEALCCRLEAEGLLRSGYAPRTEPLRL